MVVTCMTRRRLRTGEAETRVLAAGLVANGVIDASQMDGIMAFLHPLVAAHRRDLKAVRALLHACSSTSVAVRAIMA
jgi:hypothetical protein